MSDWFPAAAPKWRRYLRFWRPDIHADTDEELRHHLESRIEDLVRGGETRAQATDRALAEFGDFSRFRTDIMSIDSRIATRRSRVELLRGILDDAFYAVRSLRHAAGMTIAILATLGLGVGANAAMFTLLDAVFLRPPAGVVDPGNVKRVWTERTYIDGAHNSTVMAYLQYAAAVDALGDRARVAIYRQPHDSRIGMGDDAPHARLSFASAAYFSLVGTHAEVGRVYTPAEDALEGAAPVAVVSHAYWRNALGSDPNIIGHTIVIAGRKHTIIGVMAAPFVGVDLDAADVWVPLAFMASGRGQGGAWWKSINVNGFTLLVRPSPGANPRELEARLTATFRRPDVGFPGDSASVVRFGSIIAANGPGEQAQEVRIAVRLAAVAVIVLVIACANVINLLLARAVRRRREIAVRLALGISRLRLLRLLVTESAVLAIGSAVIALSIAWIGGSLLRKLLLPDVHWASSPVDWTIVLFALGVALAAGLLAGLVPALRSTSPELTNALKAGASVGAVQPSRLRAALVVVQAALSVVLLVGAALFVESLANIRNLGIGFDAGRLITATVNYDERTRNADPTLAPRVAALAKRIERLPGVERVALATARPMYSITFISFFTETDSLGSRHAWMPTVTAVTPGYFAASGTRILRGTDFSTAGSASTADVIVNEEMAKGLWPGRDPIGQCIRFGSRTGPCSRVSGVVENTRRSTLLEEPRPQYYLPLDHLPPGTEAEFAGAGVIVIRAVSGQTASVATTVHSLIRQEFAGAVPGITRLSDYLEPQYRPWQLGATLFSLFGLLALVVAVVGIYSTVSYGVNQRVQEFGIRMALGATVADVMRLVVGQGMRSVAVGVAVGIALALGAGKFIASLLYGVSPNDARVLTTVAVVLIVAGGVAALLPAWRAARVDPVAALRAE